MSDIIKCPDCGKRNRVPDVAAGTPRCGSCHHALPWIVTADDASFAQVAEGAGTPVLVDFWAPWCGPCRMVSPELAKLAQEKAGGIKLVKVNVDNSPRLSQRFGIQSIPTLMVLRDGKVLARQAGAAPAPALRSWLDQSLASR